MFGIGVIGLLIVAVMGFAITPVQAQTTELRITSDNLCTLWGYSNWAYWNNQLTWSYGWQLDATYERSWTSCEYTQHTDNGGNLWGECVSSVKALSKNNLGTRDWYKGRQVINGGVPSGTTIATFSRNNNQKFKSRYDHTAILKAYIVDSGWNIIGIEVWDQNWHYIDLDGNGKRSPEEGIFGKHYIYRTGSGVSNANNYYVIEV